MWYLLVSLLMQSPQQLPPTLGAELLARNLPVPRDATDLEQPITSYSALDDSRGFVIAYYALAPAYRLGELHVRSYDIRNGAWRATTFPDAIGSVLKIKRHAGILYIAGHSSPSATPLLVLSDRLELKRELDGWPVLMLGDGRVIFSRSMRHFAPTHAQVLALYDPVTDCDTALYPPATVNNDRGGEKAPGDDLWVDRSIDGVVRGRMPGTIEFVAVIQHMRLNARQVAEPATTRQRRRIVCNVTSAVPSCTSRPDQ